MASSREYLDFILEQLSGLDGISHKQMMGEYLIYWHGKYVAAVCDNRLMVKAVRSAEEYMPNAVREAPYDGAKPMLAVDNVDDREYLCGLFKAVYDELPLPKPKKVKNDYGIL